MCIDIAAGFSIEMLSFLILFFVVTLICIALLWLLFLCLCDNSQLSYLDKHVVITGGSQGIGLELAKEYLRLGARVTIIARDVVKLATAMSELKAISPSYESRISTVSLDVSTSQADVSSRLSNDTDANNGLQFGDCDVLVNCAGTSVAAIEEDLPVNFSFILCLEIAGK